VLNDVEEAIAGLSGANGAEVVGYSGPGANATERDLLAKIREMGASIVDYGADPAGIVDSTPAFTRIQAAGFNFAFVPQGTFKILQPQVLAASGLKIVGISRYLSKLVIPLGTPGPVFAKLNPAGGSAYGFSICDLWIDLNGNDIDAIDLDSVNNCTVQRIRVTGGTALAPVGRGVRMAATFGGGAYNNHVLDCDFTYMRAACVAEDGGNACTFTNVEAIGCEIGIDIEAGVDRTRIISGRCEGGEIGVRDGGSNTTIVATGFEANTIGDYGVMPGQLNATIIGAYTATTPNPIVSWDGAAWQPGAEESDGIWSYGGNFPRVDFNPHLSNPTVTFGRQTFGAQPSLADYFADPTIADAGFASAEFAAYFLDSIALRNVDAAIEFENASNDDTVLAMFVDASNRVNIPGLDRKTGVFTRIIFGEHFSFNGTGLEYDGAKVVGARKTGWTAATGTATRTTFDTATVTLPQLAERVKALLDDLYSDAGHGLLGPTV
jgi:hypothetical protein